MTTLTPTLRPTFPRARTLPGLRAEIVQKAPQRDNPGIIIHLSRSQPSLPPPPSTPSSPRRPTPEALELRKAMTRMAKGDHPALAICYDLMGTAVFSLAVRMLRDRPAAEDVSQDIFIQIWRQAGNFDPTRGSPQAWIMMIARTRILDRIRSRSAGIVLKSVGENLPDAPDADDWPDDLAISREDAANVRHALMELPEDQRLAVELAFFEGLTHIQIAERLATPLGTIKTRIRLGLIKIRDRLGDPSEGEIPDGTAAQEE